MCDYCKDFKTGNADNKPLIRGILMLGSIEINVSTFIIDDELNTDIFPTYGGYDYLFEKKVKINYCPMCGAKLEDK